MSTHNRKGATLGLMPGVILVLVLIGAALFYFAQFFGGNKQLINATDAGALATASNILAVGLKPAEISQLPPEFQAMGVDNSGGPAGVDPNTGLASSNAIFNVYAFNRAAGLTLLVALNAAEDGSPSAVNNANSLITALNSFGTKLNNDLQTDPSFAARFANLTASNGTNLLGGGSTITLGNDDKVQFASICPPGAGKANIYFNSAICSNDPTLTNWIQQITVSSGTMSSPNSRYNTTDPSAQAGQPFVRAYQALDMSAITGVPGFAPVVYTTAVSPSQLPHMVDQGRFASTAVPATCYAPINATKTVATASDSRTNLLCTALGCALLGANDNQYPVNMPYGWIRIKNNPDAVTANASQVPTLPSVPYWVSFDASIFNNELWVGTGGYAGINLANNGVFCTEAYNNSLDPVDAGPSGYSGAAELTAWITYNTTPCVDPTYRDARGLDSRLDPSKKQPDGTYAFLNTPSPTPNIRVTANYHQTATVTDMLGVTSIVAYCNSTMYIDGSTPPVCQNNTNLWTGNYHGPYFGEVGPNDTGTQASGGLTNLEFLKGEVLGAFWNFFDVYYVQNDPKDAKFNYTVNAPQLPSGSKIYQRGDAIAYSSPATYHTVAFGQPGTPADLLNQLYQYNGSCANITDDSQWNDITTPLGKLLQRCKQILPTATKTDLSTLLSTYPIDLNQYQYIYLPVGGSKLTISKTPPAFLKPYPEYTTPGITKPDSTALPLMCKDSNWDRSGTYTKGNVALPVDIFGSAINTDVAHGGGRPNGGDGNTEASPYLGFTGTLNTYDAVNWTSSSGRNNFLGEFSFGNYVNGTAGTFIQPN